MEELTDRHAIVTGGATGIGRAIAERLHAEGARVTVMARDETRLQAMCQAFPGMQYQVLDVTDEASVQQAFKAAELASGAVSVLVNNAGSARTAPFARTSAAQWQQMLDVNLTGVFHCIQAALPSLTQGDYGRLINIASTSGLKGYAYTAAYTAAKHGVIGLTRVLALELTNTHTTVNAICPGFTNTDIVSEAISNIVSKTGRTEAEALAELVKHNPQKRLIEPEEVAAQVVWLCSDAARSVNGQALVLAGGEIM
ncbi:SDR family NAD(P)-dependent oxidoreductase [Nitrincola sp. MINF-07-Sa-05]|uniref:SDR family NAD(P)-dependent oxidoreductase n=1 Tax=Nitrincola salilacus TaxID=3400273 RepID=UPI003917FFEB